MFYSLVSLIAITGIAAYCANKNVWISFFHDCICPIVVIFGFLSLFIFGIFYVGAKHKADIINREYGTNYTQDEVFYASDVINTIREIDRKRVEVNGNILKDK